MSECVYVIQRYCIFQHWSHHICSLHVLFHFFFHDIHFWYSVQGFPNITKGRRSLLSGRDKKFCWVFYWVRKSEEEWILVFRPSLKLKSTVCKYLTRVGATLFHTLIHIHLTYYLSAYSTYSQHATMVTSLYTTLDFFKNRTSAKLICKHSRHMSNLTKVCSKTTFMKKSCHKEAK